VARPTTFEAATLAEVLRRYHELLTTHREYLNRLNVFPVPDADTGTNLGLTVQAAVDAVPATGSMVQVCTAIRRGSLMGARGASGVILSQLLGAFAAHINDTSPVSAVDFADALGAASAAADAAVVHPVEGTILTVARDAARAARVAADGASLAVVIAAARDAAAESLQRTPDLLPALRRAGVVDAGGTGFVLLLDAFLNVVAGTPLPIPPPPVDGEAPTSGDEETFPHYEVVVRLAVDEGVLDEFRRAWAALGNESTVVVAEEGWWLAHIHTEYPEAAMEVARAAGDIHDVQVTDLVAQVTEVQARRTEE
jgi:dihydroxyacetone kinase-like predicted kinase